jgi:hypothetical protein
MVIELDTTKSKKMDMILDPKSKTRGLYKRQGRVHHQNNNKKLLRELGQKSMNVIRCWSCGLYKGDNELCIKCSNRKETGAWLGN